MAAKASFLTSAVLFEQYPKDDRPEIALAGRSNAGKSSFLNAVTKSDLAKVSKSPGKTRLLNFFNFGEHYRFVDMPGYGFASRGGKEQQEWQKMIETYLLKRDNLKGLLLIIDVKRDAEDSEVLLLDFCRENNIPLYFVLTKIDRCNAKELSDRKKYWTDLVPQEVKCFFVSNAKNIGHEQVEKVIFEDWIKEHLSRYFVKSTPKVKK